MINFNSLIDKILSPMGIAVRRRRTILVPRFNQANISRFLYFKRMLDLVTDIDGDIVECGVGRGHGLLGWAYLVRDENKNRHIWAFDSFQGFPEPSEHDRSIRNPRKGEWGGTSVQDVLDLLDASALDPGFVQQQITLIKGFFNESLPKYRGNSIALLHLDVDLYESYKTGLEQLYSKVALGGITLFDEYLGTSDHLNFPGAQKAIDEFFGEDINHIQRDRSYGKYYLFRNN